MEPRSHFRLARALRQDADGPVYRWIWRPLLWVQLVLYTRMVARYVLEPMYAHVATAEFPLLRVNHLGNFVSLRSEPFQPFMVVHVAMAWGWIGGCLLQKHLVSRMAQALADPANPAHEATFRRRRNVHACVGTSLCVLALAGVMVAPVITLANHGNPPMK